MSLTYLIGDVGGTNCRLELFQISENDIELSLGSASYKSNEFTTLAEAVNRFYSEFSIEPEQKPIVACFALAGMVKDRKAKITNLNWRLEESILEVELSIDRVVFINDFAACGYGLLKLPEDKLYTISAGNSDAYEETKSEETAPKIIIGAGTGLGEAFLVHNGKEYDVYPGEGGHSDFAPRSKEEFEIMCYIRESLHISRVGVERVVSGPGIKSIYDYFTKTCPNLVNKNVSDYIESASDSSQAIYEMSVHENDPLCKQAMDVFLSCYGAEVGNAALKTLPFGGIYIAGGIAPKLKEMIKKSDFLDSYFSKGRFRQMLSNIPVHIVLETAIGMIGAREVAHRALHARSVQMEMPIKIPRTLSLEDVINQKIPINDNMMTEPNEIGYRQSSVPQKTLSRKYYNKYTTPNPQRRLANVAYNDPQSGYYPTQSVTQPLVYVGLGFVASSLFVAAFLIGRISSFGDRSGYGDQQRK